MRKEINEKNLQAVKEYVRESSDYSFESFLAKRGLLDTFEKAGSELKGCCLFHPERNPSASFNDRKGVWGCFSCGRGGDYIDLVRLTEPQQISYFSAAEKILKSDKRMQMRLGVSSVFTYTEGEKRLKPLVRKPVKLKEMTTPISYLDVARQMRGCTLEQAKTVILFMQKGLSVKDLPMFASAEGVENILDLGGVEG